MKRTITFFALLVLCAVVLAQKPGRIRERENDMAFRKLFRWRGGDGAWETVGSWDDGSNYPGDSATGSDSDDCFFDGVSGVDVTGDLDQSAATSTIRRILTAPNSVNNIGSSGSPLIVELTAASDPASVVDHLGTGTFYLQPESFGNVYLRAGRAGDAAAAMITAGVLNHAIVEAGRLDVTAAASGSISKSLTVCGPFGYANIAAGVGLPPTIIVEEGKIDCYADATTATTKVIVVGPRGTFNMFGSLEDNVRVITLADGKFNYEPAAALTSSDNPDVFNLGVFDASNAQYSVEMNTLLLGPHSTLRGSAVQIAGTVSPLGAFIDGRQEYP